MFRKRPSGGFRLRKEIHSNQIGGCPRPKGMLEHVAVMAELALPVPKFNPDPKVVVQNASLTPA